MLPEIDCQYLAVTGMITPVCTWRPILAQTLATNTSLINVPSMGRTLAFLLLELDAIVKVAIGLV